MRFFLSQLTEVWVSFLGAMIRFWDNRFQKKVCPYCEYFKTEIERMRVDSYPVAQPGIHYSAPIEREEPTPDPVRGSYSWTRKQKELEKAHLRPNKPISAMPLDKSLEELQKEFS